MPRRAMTVEDLWGFGRVGATAALPGGTALVVPVTRYDMEKNEGATRLWLQPLDGEPKALTAADASSTEPAPSPDGRRIAFVRRRGKEKAQLHVMWLDGGEAEKVTDFPLGALCPRWFPDGRRIAFLAPVLGDAPTVDGTRELVARREADPVKARTTEDRFYRYWDRWLTGGEFLPVATNVCVFGNPGTGKTHIVAAIGHELVRSGHTVLFTVVSELVEKLLAAKRDLKLAREFRKLERFDCLVLDDNPRLQFP